MRNPSLSESVLSEIHLGSVGSLEPTEEACANDDDLKKSGQHSKGSFLRLVALCWPEWKYCIGGVLGSILAGCLYPTFGLLVGETLTAYYKIPEKMKKDVAIYAEALVGMGAGALFIYTLQHYSTGVVGEHLIKRVREKMFSSKCPYLILCCRICVLVTRVWDTEVQAHVAREQLAFNARDKHRM